MMVPNGNIEISKDAMCRYVGTVLVSHFSSVMIRIHRFMKKKTGYLGYFQEFNMPKGRDKCL